MTNNVPLHSPLIPNPFVPYSCKDYVSIFAIVEVNEKELRRILSFTPFEYITNKIIISVSDFSNTDKVSYMDCAFVVPIKYEDKLGGYYFYEYENDDRAIAAGRDLWGYPKKYADIELVEENGQYLGTAKRNGETFLTLQLDGTKQIDAIEEPIVTPHFNIRTTMTPTGDIFMEELIERDTSPDFVLDEKGFHPTSIFYKESEVDPIHLLSPVNVLGGGVIKGDFYATEENGWGKVVKRVIYDM